MKVRAVAMALDLLGALNSLPTFVLFCLVFFMGMKL
jgi:hypothetical protein